MEVRNLGIDSCEQGDEEETLGRVGRRSFHCRRDKAPCVCGQLGSPLTTKRSQLVLIELDVRVDLLIIITIGSAGCVRRAVRIEDGLPFAQVGQLDDQIQLGPKHGGATGVKRNSNKLLVHPLGGILELHRMNSVCTYELGTVIHL